MYITVHAQSTNPIVLGGRREQSPNFTSFCDIIIENWYIRSADETIAKVMFIMR